MYTTRKDAWLTFTFNNAQKYAKELKANGHKDWTLPTICDLGVLWENSSRIGGFHFSIGFPMWRSTPWHWSSSQLASDPWCKRLDNVGNQENRENDDNLSLRCVRYGPIPTPTKVSPS